MRIFLKGVWRMTDEFCALLGVRRHYNADIVTKTRLAHPGHATTSGICSACIKCGACEIGKKAKTGRTLFPEPFGTTQFGAEKRLPSINDLQILPQIIGEEVIFRDVDTSVTIGGFKSNLPLVVAAMGSTIVAHKHGTDLARGAARAGIPMVIGENVMATYGEKGLKARIKPYLDEYTGEGGLIVQANVEDQKMGVPEKAVEFGTHAIELKMGQGAKMGLGGEIEILDKDIEKYRELGYTIVDRPGVTAERHSSPGTITEKSLKETLLKYKELGVPIWIKIGAGRGIIEFIKMCQRIKRKNKVPLECITVDGHGGGTGMSPWLVMNEVGLPSASIFSRLDAKKLSFDILLAGGFTNGIDVGKAMMLGASGVAMGRAFLIAANVAKVEGIVNFVKAVKEEMQMLAAVERVRKVSELRHRRGNLLALTREASIMFGISDEVRRII